MLEVPHDRTEYRVNWDANTQYFDISTILLLKRKPVKI
jgi:hypothetical protein